jgi:nicotinamidase/pyrazinamidase
MTPFLSDKGKIMSMMKRFAEDVSVEMGYDGELNEKVLAEGQRRLKPKTVLLIIDPQNDFCDPNGSLYVPGADQDMHRLSVFIQDHLEDINHIKISLDSHYYHQPFHKNHWMAGSNPVQRPNDSAGPRKYAQGERPLPFTTITLKDVIDDAWVPLYHAEEMKYMLEMLAKKDKSLTIWPVHCLLGTPGHAVYPELMTAIQLHADCSSDSDQYEMIIKGQSLYSEHYGIFQAEVEFQSDPFTWPNEELYIDLCKADRIYVAGEGKSHCVLSTLQQMVEISSWNGANNAKFLNKIHVLTDCMSSVPNITTPDGKVVEFDKMANESFREFEKLGMNFVKSTEIQKKLKLE